MDVDIEENVVLSRSVGPLIVKLNTMLKKPNVDHDLGEILDDYIEKLDESDKYLQNGIFNTNFAEAALLLQSSVAMYGKKVDLLWDTVMQYQRHLISLEGNSDERQKEEQQVKERQARYKRKRKLQETATTQDVDIDQIIVQALGFERHTRLTPCEELQESWERHTHTKRNKLDVAGEAAFFSDVWLHKDEESILKFGSYQMNRLFYDLKHVPGTIQRMTGKLYLNAFERDHLLQKFLRQKGCSLHELKKLHEDEYRNYLKEHIVKKQMRIVKSLVQKSAMLCPKMLVANVERMSTDVLLQYMNKGMSDKIKRANSVAASTCEEHSTLNPEAFDNCSELTSKSLAPHVERLPNEVVSKYLQDNIKRTTSVVPFGEDHNDSAFVDELDTEITEESRLNSRMVETTNESCRTSRVTLHDSGIGDMSCSVGNSIFDESTENSEEIEERSRIKKKRRLSFDPDADPPPKRTRVVKVKPLVKITVPCVTFEAFFKSTYKELKEGEDVSVIKATIKLSQIEPTCVISDEYTLGEDEDPLPERDTSDLEVENLCSENVSNERFAAPLPPEEPPPASTSRPISETEFERQIKRIYETQRRVSEWQAFIDKKIPAGAKEADFNIHEYGTKIIESIPDDESRKFKDIVGGKSSGEVSRFLLATLQLANTYNIEIRQGQSGTLANDTLELKLLSKERYHESLNDYMAPSEETFRERLARVQALNPGVPIHSTPQSKSRARKRRFVSEDSDESYSMPSVSGLSRQRGFVS